MRVLHVTNDFQDNGTGITNMLRVLAVAQRAAGLEVSIASEVAASSYHDELSALGVRFERIDRVATPLEARRTGVRLAARLAAGDADVVHVHTGRAALAVALGPRELRRRSVATVHNVFQRSSALMGSCAAVVCISGAARERFRRTAPWAARRLRVIHNAVDLDVAPSVPGPVLPQRSVVYVGGLHHRKGVDVLVEAVGRLVEDGDPVQLFAYGNRDQPWLEELAAPLVASGHVHLCGFTRSPRAAMAAGRVVAIPSRDEPFGLVAVEARAAGAPVVASDLGGLREALDDGRAGDVVPAGDVAAWASALRRVLDDDDHRADLVRRGRDGLHRFAPAGVAEAYSRVYRSLPAAPSPRLPRPTALR
ncbi:MAG: glycosyltransferase family 4 protein [Quadrisphaera sp.]